MKQGIAQAVFLLAVSFPLSDAQAHQEPWPTPWVNASRCTRSDADKAEWEASSLRSWATLYRSFKRYGQCDEGAIAEGYGEPVATLLAGHWPDVHELSALIKKDAMFGDFVLYHVDETMTLEQARAIRANARKHCPSGLNALCNRLDEKLGFLR